MAGMRGAAWAEEQEESSSSMSGSSSPSSGSSAPTSGTATVSASESGSGSGSGSESGSSASGSSESCSGSSAYSLPGATTGAGSSGTTATTRTTVLSESETASTSDQGTTDMSFLTEVESSASSSGGAAKKGKRKAKKKKKKKAKHIDIDFDLLVEQLGDNVYHSVNGTDAGADAFAISESAVKTGSFGDYSLSLNKVLASGHTSSVYMAKKKSKPHKGKAIAKVMAEEQVAAGKKAFWAEAKFLRLLKAEPTVVALYDVLARDRQQVLILEYLPEAAPLRGLGSPDEVQFYMLRLAEAIHACHAAGIVHQDVKPGNILISPPQKKKDKFGQLRLIDFGYSSFYFHGGHRHSFAGTPTFKAPELVMHLPIYSYAVDVWAFGVILARLVFRSEIFERRFVLSRGAATRITRYQSLMARIVQALGLDDYELWLDSMGLERSKNWSSKALREVGVTRTKRIKWSKYITKSNRALATPDLVDLIDNILVYQPGNRLTSYQVLQHPYMVDAIAKFGRASSVPLPASASSSRSKKKRRS